MMIVCQECGKKYKIDTQKIKGSTAKFKCKACQHFIMVSLPDDPPAAQQPASPLPPEAPRNRSDPVAAPKAPPAPRVEAVQKEAMKPPKTKKRRLPSRWFGLRSKMTLYFFLIPLVLIVVSGLFYLRQLEIFSNGLMTESTQTVSRMAEEIVVENARSAARQIQTFLAARPDLKRAEFRNDPEFMKICVHKVGITGYISVYSIPDEAGQSILWVDPDEKLIGLDAPGTMKKLLLDEYPKWHRIYSGAFRGEESRGYYKRRDTDGRVQEKFMVSTPVEGTPYVVSSSTYLDEFTEPMNVVEIRTAHQSELTRNILFVILTAAILLIGVTVLLYSHSLTGRIKSLTGVADRISVGELDAEIDIVSKDEIGSLGEAISRMQESIRLSIERLRRRR